MSGFERVELADGRAVLYRGDCLEVMPTLGKVDHVITDPPYGERTHTKQAYGRRGAGYRDSWVTTRGLGYGHLTPKQAANLAADFHGIACGWSLVMTSHDLVDAWESGYPGYTFAPIPIVMPGMNVRLAGDGPSSWSVWMMAMRRTGYKNGTKPGAYWAQPGAQPERGANPVKGAKPLGLMTQIVSDWTGEGETILDPFMGGGTTGIAAILQGRRFIGIESNQTHFDIACERIEAASKQSDLFGHSEAPKPAQEVLL